MYSLSVCDLTLFNLFMSSVFFTYALFKILTILFKHTFQYGGQEQELSSVLTTLKTDDINRLNRARSHTDGGTMVIDVIPRFFKIAFHKKNKRFVQLYMEMYFEGILTPGGALSMGM